MTMGAVRPPRVSRHFNRDAEAVLHEIFDGVEALRTHDGRPVVVDAGPGTNFSTFFRARRFGTKQLLREALTNLDRELGPPPSPRSGRMNARNVSVFYGANELEVAAAEVRLPVGSYVAVASFSVIRPLRLLDLSAMAFVRSVHGSLMDQGSVDRLEKSLFRVGSRNLNSRDKWIFRATAA
jgi:hypothetical protein